MSKHINGEVIIFVLDSVEILPEVYLSNILKLSEKNTILLVMCNKLISVKDAVKLGIMTRYIKMVVTRDNNFQTFLPVGILPFQRFSFIYKINLFLALKTLERKLKSKGRTFFERPIVYYLCSKRDNGLESLYIPGMFGEKLCIDDIEMLDEKLFRAKKMTKYEKNILEYADLVIVNKNISEKYLLSYKWKFLKMKGNFSQKLTSVMEMIKSWGK